MFNYTKINKAFLVLSLIYFSLSANIVMSVYSYSERVFEKEKLKLQESLTTKTSIKQDNLRKNITSKIESIDSVADNFSVKMYLSDAYKNAPSDDRMAQQQFLQNYIVSEGKKSGFAPSSDKNIIDGYSTADNRSADIVLDHAGVNPENANLTQTSSNFIPANVKEDSNSTLAIFDKNEKMVVSLGMQDNLLEIYKKIEKPSSHDKFFDIIFADDNKSAYFVCISAVKHIQNDKNTGYVLGIRRISTKLLDAANFPPETINYSKSDIVIKSGQSAIMLTATDTGTGRFKNVSSSEYGNDPAEVTSIHSPDKIVERPNISQINVLALAKNVYDNKVFIVYSLEKDKALKTAMKLNENLVWITILIELSIGLMLLLVWRHSTSVKYINLSNELDKQTTLLKLVADNQLQSMFLLNSGNDITFANRTFLTKNNLKVEEVINKPITNVLGHSLAIEYMAMTAMDTIAPVMLTKRIDKDDGEHYVQRKCIPVSSFIGGDIFFLMVENDITAIMKERARYETNLNNIIETLIRIIEQRSNYFHNHSERLEKISLELADILKVESKIRRAIEISSHLCNLYVALLPRNVINKADKLSDEEKKMVAEFPMKTIEIVQNLEFDAPVIETLKHMMERPDGTGPQGLVEAQIIESAKILKVVNDYVAMTSKRPYRDKMTPKEAIDALLKDKDAKYSSRIIFTLAAHLGV